MSDNERHCLDKVYEDAGDAIYTYAEAAGFDEVGNALFCGATGCSRACDITTADRNYKLYGDCADYIDHQQKKEKRATKSLEKVRKKTSEIALRATIMVLGSDKELPELVDPDVSRILQSLGEPQLADNKIHAVALEASARYNAMQLNHSDPEERLGDSRAVDRTLFRR